MEKNKVSVIVPCRNEEAFIEETIKNIVNQDYKNIEILIIDGESSDRTGEIVQRLASDYQFVKYFNNPDKTVSYALNIGINQSSGVIVIRMDAHCKYPNNYVSELVRILLESNSDNVGGVWITKPGNSTSKAVAIARATSSIFGIGNALYRLDVKDIKEVDTVPFGCYRREIFNKIGFFDEELVRNQDDEFNGRIKNQGGRILLIPSIKIEYFARTTLSKTAVMFYQYGFFKPLVNRKLGKPTSLRQFFPIIFLFTIFLLPIAGMISFKLFLADLFVLCLYLVLNILFSVRIAILNRNIAILWYLPQIFLIIHLSYGFGYLKGLILFRIFNKKASNEKVKLSR